MTMHALVSIVRDNVGELNPLDIAELLVILKCEMQGRGQIATANYIARGLYCYAAELAGPSAPSDNGTGLLGEEGAAG
jgi:hypothetical protein